MARQPLRSVPSAGTIFGQMETCRAEWAHSTSYKECGMCGSMMSRKVIQVSIVVFGVGVIICRSCLTQINDAVPSDETQDQERVDQIREKSPLKRWVNAREVTME